MLITLYYSVCHLQVISYCQCKSHKDVHRFEKISNIIKQFKLSCRLANVSLLKTKEKISCLLLMQFILEIVEQFADTLNVNEAEQHCCKMKIMLKQKGIFSSWNFFGAYADVVIIITSC